MRKQRNLPAQFSRPPRRDPTETKTTTRNALTARRILQKHVPQQQHDRPQRETSSQRIKETPQPTMVEPHQSNTTLHSRQDEGYPHTKTHWHLHRHRTSNIQHIRRRLANHLDTSVSKEEWTKICRTATTDYLTTHRLPLDPRTKQVTTPENTTTTPTTDNNRQRHPQPTGKEI